MSLELLRLAYRKQFQKEFPFEDISEYVSTRPLLAEDMYYLYRMRFKDPWTDKIEDPDHVLLLDNLLKIKEEKVIIHIIKDQIGHHLIFTNENVTNIIGVIMSPKTKKQQ